MDMFNNDVRLRAIKALAETLAPIEQKKSILYFSAGMQRSGEDNQVELRSAINAAIRAHVAIYAVDTRGLQAVVPGGDATPRQRPRHALFSGANVRGQYTDDGGVAGHARRRSPATPAAAPSSTRTTSRRPSSGSSATCRRTT